MHVRETYEKQFKRADFMAKYISLPCIVLSAVLSFHFWYVGDVAMTMFQVLMFVLNVVSFNMQNMVKDRCQSILDEMDEQDRKNRVRELNPSGR